MAETDRNDVLEENVATIRAWERAGRLKRTRAERLADWIVARAATAEALELHFVWFAVWIVVNTRLVPGVPAFDPFPFQFLTMVVSLEAIFLTLFVLASQNRLAREADLRSQVDLQINLLAEREMTAVLTLLHDFASHFKVPLSITAAQIRELTKTTDVQNLAARMEDLRAQDDQNRSSDQTPAMASAGPGGTK